MDGVVNTGFTSQAKKECEHLSGPTVANVNHLSKGLSPFSQAPALDHFDPLGLCHQIVLGNLGDDARLLTTRPITFSSNGI